MAAHEIESEVDGNVWKVVAEVGDAVKSGEVLIVLESMKMEIPVESPVDGVVAASGPALRRAPRRRRGLRSRSAQFDPFDPCVLLGSLGHQYRAARPPSTGTIMPFR